MLKTEVWFMIVKLFIVQATLLSIGGEKIAWLGAYKSITAGYEIWPICVNYESVKFYGTCPSACTLLFILKVTLCH
jgi:hypothetical protein